MNKVFVVSLGCDKNLVDTEKMLYVLAHNGFLLTDREEEAEVIVINTCCFIGDAKEESINTIIAMGELKKTGNLKALIVCGCLAERYRQEIETELPEVDGILGITSWQEIVQTIKDCLAGKKVVGEKRQVNVPKPKAGQFDGRIMTTGGYFAYLKIAEGCNKRCTYCVIPKVRGAYASVPMEELVAEAESLVENGARELILVAQETTMYGIDLYGKKSLHILLSKLSGIEKLRWIRLLYCYPEEIYEDLVKEIRENPKVCHYLDLPIQHASNAMLAAMGRRTTKESIKACVAMLRETIPDIAIRTTLIAGFPGETQEMHEEALRFVDEMSFDRLGVFAYSPEEGTVAEQLPGQIPDEEKNRRRDEIMALQQEVAFDLAQEMIGRELCVMVEGRIPEEDTLVCRSYMDAPSVDGLVFVKTKADLVSGEFITVKVTGAKGYDLIADIMESD